MGWGALVQQLLQLLPDASQHVPGRRGVQVNAEASSPTVEAELRHAYGIVAGSCIAAVPPCCLWFVRRRQYDSRLSGVGVWMLHTDATVGDFLLDEVIQH